jgi:hypothetical protein
VPTPAKRSGRFEERAAALTGAGPSILGVDGAMRAREVSRPTAEDDAAAERVVQVSFRPRNAVGSPQPAAGGSSGGAGSSPDAS